MITYHPVSYQYQKHETIFRKWFEFWKDEKKEEHTNLFIHMNIKRWSKTQWEVTLPVGPRKDREPILIEGGLEEAKLRIGEEIDNIMVPLGFRPLS